MKKTKLLLVVVLVTTMFMSCAPAIVGNWKIEKYQNAVAGQQVFLFSDVGTISFKGDGTGEKEVTFKVFDLTKTDNTPFTWSITDNFLTIVSEGSELSKTWIQVKNQKSYQYLTSTDGAEQVQILELKKGK